jgi:uncharacterized protein YbbK (DUF523 family)
VVSDYGRFVVERSGAEPTDRGPQRPLRPLIVSACLLGIRCNHEGSANTSAAVVSLGERFRLVPVCPETAGGLPTPRPAAERQPDGSVRNVAGSDVSDAYARGAAHTVRLAAACGASAAVLKARSPSCGCHEIYDGSFTRTRIPGEGVTAQALRAAHIPVYSEDDITSGRLPT